MGRMPRGAQRRSALLASSAGISGDATPTWLQGCKNLAACGALSVPQRQKSRAIDLAQMRLTNVNSRNQAAQATSSFSSSRTCSASSSANWPAIMRSSLSPVVAAIVA